MIKIIIIDSNSADQRIDRFLKRIFKNINQSFIEKNLRKKNILLNQQLTKSNQIIKVKDEIIIKNYSKEIYHKFEKKKSTSTIHKSHITNFKQSILYENDNFLIIDKWSGIAAQGGSNIMISIDTIIKNISEHYNLVHRLDKETSGLMIIAKNLHSTRFFGKLFKSQKLKKTYLAICDGMPKIKESYLDLDINSNNNDKLIKTNTFYKVISYNNKTSLIKFEPKTGKKHQLRIVAKKLGCPIVGDQKYNLNQNKQGENLKLNAFKLEFDIEDNEFKITSALPKNFTDYLILKNIKFNPKII
ncbi:RluA family pseudouridine synthase [Alphaproteobacteria bacterium]|nr:RluA family pseudouridine synthase [Alphaproteobacteria bacterium]